MGLDNALWVSIGAGVFTLAICSGLFWAVLDARRRVESAERSAAASLEKLAPLSDYTARQLIEVHTQLEATAEKQNARIDGAIATIRNYTDKFDRITRREAVAARREGTKKQAMSREEVRAYVQRHGQFPEGWSDEELESA